MELHAGGAASSILRNYRSGRKRATLRATVDIASLYRRLNREFFRGRLPAYRIRFRQFAMRGKEGECGAKARTITLAIHLKRDPTRLRQRLLHEMCHIGSPGHGPLSANMDETVTP
jgi:hypothetical protein